MKENQGFAIVALMCLGIFVCMIDTTIMNIALPAIQNDLHASLETMSWILNVYTMSIAVLSIPLSRMAEIFGKGKFFLLGAGFGLIVGPASMDSAGDFEGEMLTAAQGVTQMFRQLSVVLAVAIFVSGLTHYLDVQRHVVMDYAAKKTAALDVPPSVKASVLAESKKQLQSSEMTAASGTAAAPYRMSEADRQRLIAQNVNEALASMPKAVQDKARPQVTAEVARKVDAEIQKVSSQVNGYSADLKVHAKAEMAQSFAKLYQAGLPVVFATAVVSFLFLNRRRRTAAPALPH